MRSSTVGKKIKEFHKACGIDKGYDLKTVALRLDLLLEEMMETVEAAGFEHDEEKGLSYKHKVRPADLLKELCDVVYVAVGWAATHGWDFDEAFRRVHASNMSKVPKDGKVRRREDGKILKPGTYMAPDLKDLV